MKTIDIKGKSYVMVNERILEFRRENPDHSLRSEMIHNEGGVCIFKAEVVDMNGDVVATGHAYEKEGSTFINKTSYIENCETSAWGRALGCLGIGIGESIASAEEVGNAIKQQETAPKDFVSPTQEQKHAMKELLVDAGLCNPGKNLTMKNAKDFNLTELSKDEFQAKLSDWNTRLANGEKIQ